MDIYFVSVVLFFALLAVLIYRDRKNVEFKYVVVMRRTKRFRDLIDGVAGLSPKWWKRVYSFAIAVCFAFMVVGVFSISEVSVRILLGMVKQPGLQLILPTPVASGAVGPGYILIPFWFWIAVIGIILVPHEFSHGIAARAEKIRLKSVGLMLLAIFPGAFVEPDDNQLKRSKLTTRLRVFGAGSFANFSVALLVFLFTAFVVWPGFAVPGVSILDVNETGPAYAAGIRPNMTVTELNGRPVESTFMEHLGGRGYFADEIAGLSRGDMLTMVADGKAYSMVPDFNEATNTTSIGITYKPLFRSDETFFLSSVIPFLNMVWLFSLAVGMVNLLPLYPLDGGLMFEAISQRYLKKRSKVVVKAVTILMLLIMLFDFFGPAMLNP
ncbi:MAG: site-2 protease family protein [Candidatus Aenigmatarchaeota archaeon]